MCAPSNDLRSIRWIGGPFLYKYQIGKKNSSYAPQIYLFEPPKAIVKFERNPSTLSLYLNDFKNLPNISSYLDLLFWLSIGILLRGFEYLQKGRNDQIRRMKPNTNVVWSLWVTLIEVYAVFGEFCRAVEGPWDSDCRTEEATMVFASAW